MAAEVGQLGEQKLGGFGERIGSWVCCCSCRIGVFVWRSEADAEAFGGRLFGEEREGLGGCCPVAGLSLRACVGVVIGFLE